MAQTLKFSRTSGTRTRLTIDDVPALTLPNGDWTVGCVIVVDGAMSGYGGTSHWMMCNTDNSNTAGSFLMALYPFDTGSSTTAGRFVLGLNGSVQDRCLSAGVVEQGKAYVIVAHHANGLVTTKMCPVLSAAPVDGSAVLTSATSALTNALDSATAWMFGDRTSTGRRCDHSLGRFFRIDRALTDLEIAKLAYGYQITDIGVPALNILANDPTNIVDSGPNAFPITVSGPPAAGSNPGFGYVPTVNPPTIDGAPTLVGGASVGSVKGYNPAPAAGTPTPTIKQQWTLDGADIAGATGATYTPVAGDVGKVLRVRQIASNANGNTPSTSNGIVVTSAATVVTVTEQIAERIFQQIGGTAVVPLFGTLQGEIPASIEYQLYAPDGITVDRAWTDAGATIDSGALTWSAAPAMPTPNLGKKYKIAVRGKNAAGNVIYIGGPSANRFGVGADSIVVGSSTPAAWFDNGTAVNLVPDHDRVSVYSFETGAWGLFGEYGVAIEMANYLSQQLGYPVGLAKAAKGGTSLASWLDMTSPQGDWARFQTILTGMGGKVQFIFGSVGSNDTISLASVVSRANHLANLRLFASRLRTAVGDANLPIIWQGINRRTSADTNELAAEYARMAETDFGGDANVFHYQTLQYVLSSDGVHMLGSNSRTAANELTKMGLDAMRGNYRRGPKISGYTYSGAGATGAKATLQHRNGTDFTPTSAITGFTGGDSNGAITVTASRDNATQIDLAFDRPVVGPLWIKYLAGKGPDTTAAVMDNGAQSLPLLIETDLAPVSSAGNVIDLVIAPCSQANSCTTLAADVVTGPKTINLAIAPCSQANTSDTAVVSVTAGPKTITLSVAPCEQSNASSTVAVNVDEMILSYTPSTSRTLIVKTSSTAPFAAKMPGYWNLTANPKVPYGLKDPSDVIDVPMDWSEMLADIGNAGIASASITVGPGLEKVAADVYEGKLQVGFFAAGTVGRVSVTYHIRTDSSPPREFDRTFQFLIEER